MFNEIKQLKNEINNLKELHDKINKDILIKKKENESPMDIKYLCDISSKSYAWVNLENTFTVFKSINNIFYLIYETSHKSIICYDLNNQKKINELKNTNKEYITNFKHYLNEINKRDLIMSISRHENEIKVWNANNWEYLLIIKNINNVGFIYSACFYKEKDEIFIITINRNMNCDPEAIKVFNFNGQKIKEINNSRDHIFFIDVYFDKILLKNYIITGNFGYVKSYDYSKK